MPFTALLVKKTSVTVRLKVVVNTGSLYNSTDRANNTTKDSNVGYFLGFRFQLIELAIAISILQRDATVGPRRRRESVSVPYNTGSLARRHSLRRVREGRIIVSICPWPTSGNESTRTAGVASMDAGWGTVAVLFDAPGFVLDPQTVFDSIFSNRPYFNFVKELGICIFLCHQGSILRRPDALTTLDPLILKPPLKEL